MLSEHLYLRCIHRTDSGILRHVKGFCGKSVKHNRLLVGKMKNNSQENKDNRKLYS